MTKSFQSIKKYRPFYFTRILISIGFIAQISQISAQDFSYELVATGTQSPDVIFDVELIASGTEEVYESKPFYKDIPHFKVKNQWTKECASRSTQVCLPNNCELDVSRTHTDSNKLSGNYGGPGYGVFVSNPYFHSGSGASHRLSYQNGSWCLNSNIKICSKSRKRGSAHYSGRNYIYGKCTYPSESWTQTQKKGTFTINEKTGYSKLAEYDGQIGSLGPNTLKEEFIGTEEYSVAVPYFEVKGGSIFFPACQNRRTTVCLPNYCELDVSRSYTTSNKIANNVGRPGYGIVVSRQRILGSDSTAIHTLYQDASRKDSRSWCLASDINLCARSGTSFYEGKNVIYGKCTSLGQKRGPIGEKKIYSVEVFSQKDSSGSDILGDILQLEMFDSKSSISGVNGRFFWAKTTYRTPWSSSKQGMASIPTISGITNVDFISDIAPNNDTIYTASITVPPNTGTTYIDNDGDGVIDAGGFVGWLSPAHEFLVALDGPPLAVIDGISPNPAEIGQNVSFSGHGEHYEPIINAVWQTNRLLASGSEILHTCLETPCNFNKNNLPNGQHLISFFVETAKTASPAATKILKINQAPKASIVLVKSTGEKDGIVKAVKWSDNEPHDPIHFVGQAVDLDGVITKYEWKSTRVDEDRKRGKEEIIGNTPSFTYTNLSLGKHEITLHVEDDNGRTAVSNSRKVEVLKPPVLLVHGLGSKADKTWGWLDGNTVNGYEFNAVDISPNNERLSYGAKIISEEIQHLVESYGVPKVNIIAHSMGGVNSRWYIQNPGYRNDVNKLVMLGTPNHGSTLAAIVEPSKSGKHKFSWFFLQLILKLFDSYLSSGPAILDLIPQSSALRALNYNKKDEGFDKDQPRDNIKTVYNSQIPYFNIYGKNLPSLSHKHIIIDLLFDEWEIVLPTLSFNTDLIVDGKSAQLDGTSSKSFPWVCHDRDLLFGEDEICPEGLPRVDKVFQQALQYLGSSNPSLQTSLSIENSITDTTEDSITDTTQTLAEQILFVTEEPPVISMEETKQHQFNVDSEIGNLHVVLMSSFPEGSPPSLSFSLVSPSGVLFDENTISPDVTYEIGPNSISYSINNVEKGDWTAIVKSTSNEPTQYMLIASGETDFWVGMVEGGQVKPMEPFTITAYAQKAGSPLTGLEVKAALFKTLDEGERINSKYGTDLRNVEPIEIALTDLGDGRYETTYNDTLIPGVYYVLVTATDLASGLSRETFTSFFVEYQFELSVQDSDISFSNDNPEHNENIIISAEIHNNSDLEAKAVEVWFADGRLDDGGTVFAKETIDNIAANGKAVISTSWTAKAGTHEMVVIVSPLNTFVENNVTNNIASKTIIVADQPPIAVAGNDQTARFDSDTQTNVHIFLDGGNSTDDTGIERYEWDINTQVDSNGDGIADNDTDLVGIQPFISAGTYTEVGEYEVKLTVFDKADQSNADTLTIHLVEAYDLEPPIAEAGSDQIARIREPIYFDGSGSYDNYGIATYSWDIDVNTDSNGDGIADNDIDLTGVRPTLSWGYSIEGIYTAKLTVNDVAGNEPAADTLTVYVGDQFYRIQGYVKDKLGIPIANAKITVNGQTVITQETGYWEIIGITPGKYTLIASKTDYHFVPKNFVVAGNEHTINLNIDVVNSALCQLYAVNDGGLNRSQFFTTALNSLQVNKLGPLYVGYDIEALATHPQTNIIYAASGDDTTTKESRGYLYIVDGQTGELFPVGSTGFDEIEALTFDSTGTLWAWAKGDGLVVIDPNTGDGNLFMPSDVSIEAFTSSKTGNTLFYGAANTDLWVYDADTNRLEVVCTNLLGETEALEMMLDGSLLFGTHQDKTLSLHAFDPNTCNVISGIEIPTYKFNDVEGITLPIEVCLK